LVLGTEFAGVVEELGRDASGFAVGDRVFGYCEGTFGAHGELMVIHQDEMVAEIPEGWSFEDAAAATEGAHYALSNIRAANIDASSSVLVYGATGAIGSAAIQILKAMRADVTAVGPTAQLDLVRGLGPDRVVDYQTTDFTQDERTHDVVFDAVGKSSFSACKPLLKPKGIYMSTDLGPFPTNPVLALLTPLRRKQRVLFPIPKQNKEMIEYLQGLMIAGTFKPVIDRTYPLDDIVEAYRYVESGKKVGNVILRIAEGSD
jgi:NADPH:quinone reductase-like Zn-dependent oxidoreductase